MSEHRDDMRSRCLKAGLIIFNGGNSTFNCTLRNLSQGGAKLTFECVPNLPDHFVLRLSDGAERPCTVRWRRSLDVGVSFDETASPVREKVSYACL